MKQYLELLKTILEKGEKKCDRTGTGTISYFGYQMRFNLNDGFPLLTTKKVHLRSIIEELLWFIKGDTNIKYLVERDVKIWNDWPYAKYVKSSDYKGESMEEFIEKIKNDDDFALKYGKLGPVYGEQWRAFQGYNGEIFDQLKWVIDEIRNNPDSRRLIVSSWNAPAIKYMALPPCHMMFQFYVSGNKLSLQLYQRSADTFLGVPFNIASYALLLMMVAKITNLEPYEFVHTIGDAHIYLDHLDQVNKQLSREPRGLPKMIILGEQKEIEDFKIDDFVLEGYDPHKGIKAKVSV